MITIQVTTFLLTSAITNAFRNEAMQTGSRQARNKMVTTAHMTATRMARLWRRAVCSFYIVDRTEATPPAVSGVMTPMTTPMMLPYSVSSRTDGRPTAVKNM